MQQLDTDVWIADSPLRFLGLEVGARMTVLRLPGPKLLLHSPVAPSKELAREVEALGPVAYLVAPNRFHHLFVGDWQQAFPEARVYVAPGLDAKRPDLEIAGVLGDAPEPEWAAELDQVLVGGFPLANEVVFFHRPSRTLVLTDIAFNIGPGSPLPTRVVFRLAQGYGSLTPSLLERLLARDRPAFRRSLERILEWPFERVVVSHGDVVESGGREQLERGYAWLLGDRPAKAAAP